ncbi:MAG: hypothetical protein K6E50_03620 [Lachnospiraceae bacterium]|nr:hypothetical protein [Lachnospiraceae bacterium]
MKRKWNKALSWLLTLTMLVGSFTGWSIPVLADGEETASVSVSAITTESFDDVDGMDGSSAEKALSVSVNKGDFVAVSFNTAVVSGNGSALADKTVSWNLSSGGDAIGTMTLSENANSCTVSGNTTAAGTGAYSLRAWIADGDTLSENTIYFKVVVTEPEVIPDPEPEAPTVSLNYAGFDTVAGKDGSAADKALSVTVSFNEAFSLSFNAAVVSANGAVLDEEVSWKIVSANGAEAVYATGISASQNGNLFTVSGQSAVSVNASYKLSASFNEAVEDIYFNIVVEDESVEIPEPEPEPATSISVNYTGFDEVAGKNGSAADKALSVTVSYNEALSLSFNASVVSANGAVLDEEVSWKIVSANGAKAVFAEGISVSKNGNVFTVSGQSAVSVNASYKLSASFNEAVEDIYFNIVVEDESVEIPEPEPEVASISVNYTGFDAVAGKNGSTADKALSISVSNNDPIALSFNAVVVSGNEILSDKTVSWNLVSANGAAAVLLDGLKVSENASSFTVSGQVAVSSNASYKLVVSSEGVESTEFFFDIFVGEQPKPEPPVDDVVYNWGKPEWKWVNVTGDVTKVPTAVATFTCSANDAKQTQEVVAEVSVKENTRTGNNGKVVWEAYVKEPVRDAKAPEKNRKEYYDWKTVTFTVSEDGTISNNKIDDGMGGQEVVDGIEIIGLQAEYNYTGAKIKPVFTVVDIRMGEEIVLAEGTDYTVKTGKNVETSGTISIKGKGNYAGKSVDKSFKIVKPTVSADSLDMKGAKITTKFAAMTFNGKAQIPATLDIKLKGAKTALSYTWDADKQTYVDKSGNEIAAVVTFSNNVNKGNATVCVNGKNGTYAKKNYKIGAADISTISVNEIGEVEWAVKAQPVEMELGLGEYVLIEGADYKVKYTAANAGKGTAKLTGKGNFKGKKEISYTVNALELDEELIVVNAVSGKAGKVKVTVVDRAGNALGKKLYDFKVLSDGKTLGSKDALPESIDVVVTSKNANLSADKEGVTVSDIDVKKAIKKMKVQKGYFETYTGQPIILDELDDNPFENSAKINTNGLTYGEDFVIASYKNNVKKGSMIVTLRGIGNYSGTTTVKIPIKAASLGNNK